MYDLGSGAITWGVLKAAYEAANDDKEMHPILYKKYSATITAPLLEASTFKDEKQTTSIPLSTPLQVLKSVWKDLYMTEPGWVKELKTKGFQKHIVPHVDVVEYFAKISKIRCRYTLYNGFSKVMRKLPSGSLGQSVHMAFQSKLPVSPNKDGASYLYPSFSTVVFKFKGYKITKSGKLYLYWEEQGA